MKLFAPVKGARRRNIDTIQRSEKEEVEAEGEKKKAMKHERQERRGGTYGYFCIRKRKKDKRGEEKFAPEREEKTGMWKKKTFNIYTTVFH